MNWTPLLMSTLRATPGQLRKRRRRSVKFFGRGKPLCLWTLLAPTQAERTAREQSDFLLWENARGEFLDFHSFRASFITSLVEGGATIKQVQVLARHKDATTTLKHYIKCKDKAELAGVVSALPALMVSTPQNENKKCYQECYQNPLCDQECHQNLEALGYLESLQESEIENISETQVVDNSVVYGVLPGEIGSALDGNRTCNLRFRRPMLYPVELQVHLFQ